MKPQQLGDWIAQSTCDDGYAAATSIGSGSSRCSCGCQLCPNTAATFEQLRTAQVWFGSWSLPEAHKLTSTVGLGSASPFVLVPVPLAAIAAGGPFAVSGMSKAADFAPALASTAPYAVDRTMPSLVPPPFLALPVLMGPQADASPTVSGTSVHTSFSNNVNDCPLAVSVYGESGHIGRQPLLMVLNCCLASPLQPGRRSCQAHVCGYLAVLVKTIERQ